MGWYYYSGNIVKSIPVSRTKSVAVRPNSKIEILELTQEAQAMLSAGILKRSGKPLGAKSMEDAPVRPNIRLRDVLPPSSLAQHFAEKGVTLSAAMPPRKPVGSQEFTIHEMEMKSAAVAPVVAPIAETVAETIVEPVVAPVVDGDDAAVLHVEEAAEDNESAKSKRRRGQ
jgi:hypothetical protein